MAKKAKVYTGTEWVDLASATADLSGLQTKAATGLNLVIPTSATNGTIAANGQVTIGSAVSSVTVNGAFSSTYDNYRIIISGGVGSTANNIGFTLGATTTGYYEARINCTYSTGVVTATSPLGYDAETQTVSIDVNAAGITINGTAVALGGTIVVEARLG
jgi:hypothetical protein